MNYDKLRHLGRAAETAFEKKPEKWHPNQAVKAASAGASVSGESRARMEIDFDEGQRDSLSKTRELITLTREPEIRDTPRGRVVVFRGMQEGRDRPISAIMRAPVAEKYDPEARASLDDSLRRIGGGDQVSLAGKWAKKRWEQNGVQREAWEFQAQRFREGDVPLERFAERGPVEADRTPMVSPAVAAVIRERGNGSGF